MIILGSFLFWSLPAMVGNTFMPIRSVFAWAFDRLLPEKFAEVNERTHSPVPAILLVMASSRRCSPGAFSRPTSSPGWRWASRPAWCAWSSSAIAAIMFPSRRPDLYQASPANVRFAGIPVLYIVAPLSILVMLFLVWLTRDVPGARARPATRTTCGRSLPSWG